jgi:hypothetical protein
MITSQIIYYRVHRYEFDRLLSTCRSRSGTKIDNIERSFSNSNFRILLLATSGYGHMLNNFLCYASQFSSSKYIVVLTPHTDIVELCQRKNISVMILSMSFNSSSSFGSYEYQSLIVQRTAVALDLLNNGINVIIADIDAVWLRDPLALVLSSLDDSKQDDDIDIAVVRDEDEICGCFVVLKSTANTNSFWLKILEEHQQLVDEASNIKKLKGIFDSEQKILTRMLLQKAYDGNLHAKILSSDDFPSGLQYFSKSSSLQITTPSVVHNNFIIGLSTKIDRFRRYQLWSLSANDVCIFDSLAPWKKIFLSAMKELRIPTISLVLPLHMASIDDSPTTVILQVMTENLCENVSTGKIWVKNDPPSYIDFKNMGIYDLNIPPGNRLSAIAVTMDNIPIDLSVNLGHKSDSNLSLHMHERIYRKFYNPGPPQQQNQVEINVVGTQSPPSISYLIKVLAYNRPSSLRRLLTSLSNAYYDSHIVDIEIFVDGWKDGADKLLVEEVISIAEAFTWIYGNKAVTIRGRNQGLVHQWRHVWKPEESDWNRIALVFEDDMEVSKYYFRWMDKAVRAYYVNDTSQLDFHHSLLKATRNVSTLQAFYDGTIGEPILYGVCLQKQHLDPSHASKLCIRNGNQPFLYR